MKKVELHLHLDGSVRESTVAELLGVNEKDIENKLHVNDYNSNLTEYLTKFDMPIKVMQTKENLSRIARELGEDLEKDGIIYAEVRFAPQLHTKKGLSYDDIVLSVIEGFKKCNIKINVILCMMRGASYINNLKTIEVAEKYLNKGVVALDLAGDEKHFKTKDYEELFKIAKEKNIPFTIHAGEADDTDIVVAGIVEFLTCRAALGIGGRGRLPGAHRCGVGNGRRHDCSFPGISRCRSERDSRWSGVQRQSAR